MIYNVNTEKELLHALKLSENSTVINIEKDITLSEAIVIENCKDIKIISKKGCKLIGGIITNEWNAEGEYVTFKTEVEPRVLIVNGSLREKSSFPQDGYLEYLNTTEHKWKNSRNGGWDSEPTESELTHITVKPEDLPDELDIENCDIRAIHMWDESTVSIKKYDKNTGEIVTAYHMGHPAGAFKIQKYQLLNSRYALNKKGTWCYDRKEKKVYYYPLDGETADNTTVMIPVSNSVIKIKNCENVTVENIKILLSNSICGQTAGLRAINPLGAVQVENSKNIKLDMLEISFSGGNGIKILNSQNISVENSIVTQCASGGIFTHECEDEKISYNNIENVGMYDFSAIPIHAGGKSLLVYVLDGKLPEKGKTVIEYNTIDNAPYCGITCNGGPHIIRNNKITRCMQELNDGAAIYCSRADKTQVTGNFITDVPDKNAYSVYLDELSENCIIDGNVSVNVKTPFHNHIARNSSVKNNIIINNGETVIKMVSSTDYLWENNLIYSVGDIIFDCDAFDYIDHEFDKFIKTDRDILYSENGKVIYSEDVYGKKKRYEELKCGIIGENPGITLENNSILIKNKLNEIKNRYIVRKTEPHCVITKIKPEKEEEYKRLHNNIWDLVIKNGHLYGIRNYSIFKYGDLYVSFFEYIGEDFEKDMEKKNRLPVIRKWQELCKECFEETDIDPKMIFFERF